MVYQILSYIDNNIKMVVDARASYPPVLHQNGKLVDAVLDTQQHLEPEVPSEHTMLARKIRGLYTNFLERRNGQIRQTGPEGLFLRAIEAQISRYGELSYTLSQIEAMGEMGFKRIDLDFSYLRDGEAKIEAGKFLRSLTNDLLLKPVRLDPKQELEHVLTEGERWKLWPRVLAPRGHKDQVVSDQDLRGKNGRVLWLSPLYQVYAAFGRSSVNRRLIIDSLTLASANYPTKQP